MTFCEHCDGEEDFDFSYKSVPPKRTLHMVMMSQEKAERQAEVVEAARALLGGPNGEEHSWVQEDDWRRLQAALGALEARNEGSEE
jgi:hypothetical protein